ncbi:MAG: aminotransferase class I/II-fold pyridoxal phosphate-dependent enzyme [Clostridia bacterium]|nr:aminotransferase class I/II-fold pyridoxal phosphate-dependent enzyme [Clostridia bacterium]
MYRIGQEEKDAVARVIDSKELFKVNGGAQETYHFEEELKAYFHTDHTILMTSGKAALISALIGMGVGPGDEVIIPAYTYIATAIAVVAVGAIPIIAEIDDSLMIDPADVERKITERTKVILPVHMQGYPCNMDAITAIAKKHNLMVLEDACQAVGTSYHGKFVGTIGNAGAFSFNYFKIISAGEGGALLTNSRQIFEKALIHHDSSAIAYFGNQMEDFSVEPFCGTEYRANEITAAILREQLKKLDGIVHDLHKNKRLLCEAIGCKANLIPCNDPDGESAMVCTMRFETAEEALRFSEAVSGVTLPIKTGKHVYSNWDVIMGKRGAAHPLMDPFKMPANRVPDYSPDMCAASLERLAKCAHFSINPDWTEADIEKRAAEIRRGLEI